jgi:hypothetical protein
MKRIFLLLAGLTTLFTLLATPVQSTVPATPTLQTQAQSEVQTFMGTILKNGEKFVLSDSATKTRYALDNTNKARVLEGKAVKVTGTLDMVNALIHVKTIENIV